MKRTSMNIGTEQMPVDSKQPSAANDIRQLERCRSRDGLECGDSKRGGFRQHERRRGQVNSAGSSSAMGMALPSDDHLSSEKIFLHAQRTCRRYHEFFKRSGEERELRQLRARRCGNNNRVREASRGSISN
eukprot:gb/GECG01011934.1/.p1 GENE.gb/GECG01011934.1/~~gb/GECG01011934.1/.p1  ORF type:complete len:131 (+),score=10.46 gb/GECG01011934.1/:1-393(+)